MADRVSASPLDLIASSIPLSVRRLPVAGFKEFYTVRADLPVPFGAFPGVPSPLACLGAACLLPVAKLRVRKKALPAYPERAAWCFDAFVPSFTPSGDLLENDGEILVEILSKWEKKVGVSETGGENMPMTIRWVCLNTGSDSQ